MGAGLRFPHKRSTCTRHLACVPYVRTSLTSGMPWRKTVQALRLSSFIKRTGLGGEAAATEGSLYLQCYS